MKFGILMAYTNENMNQLNLEGIVGVVVVIDYCYYVFMQEILLWFPIDGFPFLKVLA